MAYTRDRLPHSSSLSPSFNYIRCAAIAFGTCCSYVVEGGGPLSYYIHTVSFSILRYSKLRSLLGPPLRARMAAEIQHDVMTGEQGSPVAGDSTKRHKLKGAHHAFDWEALEDPNMRAEKDWKNEKEEYWS
jgi:hypothetical protein